MWWSVAGLASLRVSGAGAELGGRFGAVAGGSRAGEGDPTLDQPPLVALITPPGLPLPLPPLPPPSTGTPPGTPPVPPLDRLPLLLPLLLLPLRPV